MEDFEEIPKVYATIRFRRSVRNYIQKPIEKWKMDVILESARLAPSSTNGQPWRIFVVKNPNKIEILSKSTYDRVSQFSWLKNCPVVLILCSSKSGIQKAGQMIGMRYNLVDMGIVGDHICLTAAELNIGSCWIGWINKKKIRNNFDIPKKWEIVCLISLGYPKIEKDQEPNSIYSFREYYGKIKTLDKFQKKGELGIGNIGANKRKERNEIIFYDH